MDGGRPGGGERQWDLERMKGSSPSREEGEGRGTVGMFVGERELARVAGEFF